MAPKSNHGSVHELDLLPPSPTMAPSMSYTHPYQYRFGNDSTIKLQVQSTIIITKEWGWVLPKHNIRDIGIIEFVLLTLKKMNYIHNLWVLIRDSRQRKGQNTNKTITSSLYYHLRWICITYCFVLLWPRDALY